MLQYVIAGLVLGGIYAIASSSLVVTFLSSGILNFSFGALAYTVARFYYYLNVQLHWSIAISAVLSILGLGPTMGVLLYFALFKHLRFSTTMVKVVATLGISVALPSLDTVLFGNQTIIAAPGLAPQPVRVFDVLGVPVTMDQIIVYASVLVVVVIGFGVLHYTDVGLRIRAMVDSPAMTSLSGTNPDSISVGVWAVSTGLAGLTGVLSAPIIGLDSGVFTLLMVAAFAAVIVARFRSLPVAFLVALLIGIAGALVQYGLPPNSSFTAAVLPSVPFIVTAIFLVYFMVRGGVDEAIGVGGALDRAITPQAAATATVVASSRATAASLSWRAPAVGFIAVCALPLILHGFWVGLMAQGVCYGIIFLSYTMVAGEGGMIWLCQSVLAGVGGFALAILASNHGWPVPLAILTGGLVAAPFGLLIGVIVIRMGDLYVALVTLIFALLVENLVFTRQTFTNNGTGVTVALPSYLSSTRVFAWFTLGVFVLVALINVNLRHSTSGLALGAIRATQAGAKTLGISVLNMKVLIGGLAAFVAGIGGALLALSFGVALPTNYDVLLGVVWLAVLVTQGIRSNAAALIAGLSLTLASGVATSFLPQIFSNFVPVLFGLGAVAMVRFPSGLLTIQARQFRALMANLRDRSPRGFDWFRLGTLVYGIAFVVLIVTDAHLWWLWLAITAALHTAVFNYLMYQEHRMNRRNPVMPTEPAARLP